MRKFLKLPGGWRILIGGTIVSLLLIASLFGSNWARRHADEMDLSSILVPPSVLWLKSALTTQKGLEVLQLNQENANGQYKVKENLDPSVSGEDNLDYLQSGEKNAETTQAVALKNHFLGTDKNGHDMVALLLAGTRNCLLPGLLTCAVALFFGIPMGLLAGYYGGNFERLVRGFSGVILSLPRLVLILVVVCALEPNIYYIMFVLGITLIPRVAELIATRVNLLVNLGFVLAAKEAGLNDFTILYRHLFWYQNRAVAMIQFSLIMAESILMETTLSYLQFGTKPPEVSWGNIIEGSQETFFSGLYWLTFFPAVAIILSILGFFYLGDGLNARLAYREGK